MERPAIEMIGFSWLISACRKSAFFTSANRETCGIFSSSMFMPNVTVPSTASNTGFKSMSNGMLISADPNTFCLSSCSYSFAPLPRNAIQQNVFSG